MPSEGYFSIGSSEESFYDANEDILSEGPIKIDDWAAQKFSTMNYGQVQVNSEIVDSHPANSDYARGW